MANVFKAGGGGGRLIALALVILVIVLSSSQTITLAVARSPYNPARQLATDCNSPKQGTIAGCGGGSGGSGGPAARPRPSGPTPGSSRCKKGCCGTNKFGECVCCR